MKKFRLYKFLFVFLLLPAHMRAQDITGLWKGELYVDSTKKYLPFELSISEVKGKLAGYSHITFEENGKQETGLRDVTIQRKGNEVIIEDLTLLDNSFSFTPPKNIKKTMVVTLIVEDTIMVLEGNWSTNRTRRFLSATGTVKMQRKNDFKTTVLYKKLADLKLADQLVFNEPEKKTAPEIEEPELPKIENNAGPAVLIDPDGAKKKAPATVTVKARAPLPLPSVAIVPKPVETKKPDAVLPPPPAIVQANKPGEIKKAAAASTSVTSAITVVKKADEAKKAPPVTSKPAAPQVAVAVTKPAPVKPAVAISPKPISTPVVTAPAVIEKPREPAVAVVEKKPEPILLPGAAEGAEDVNKRDIASTQSVFFQSDSLVLTLYDNGYVDGDTVSVVMNGEVIFSKQGLSTKAVSKTIHITKDTPDSIKLVMYAENLGSIPPNTGLLVVHDGEAIYDVRFTADLKTNAAIILRRKKKA